MKLLIAALLFMGMAMGIASQASAQVLVPAVSVPVEFFEHRKEKPSVTSLMTVEVIRGGKPVVGFGSFAITGVTGGESTNFDPQALPAWDTNAILLIKVTVAGADLLRTGHVYEFNESGSCVMLDGTTKYPASIKSGKLVCYVRLVDLANAVEDGDCLGISFAVSLKGGRDTKSFLFGLLRQVKASTGSDANIAAFKLQRRQPGVAPKVEAPKVEAPKVEAPKVEAPKVEAPKVEAPKVEAPKVEAPKVEAPKVEAPKVEAPKVEAPKGKDLLEGLLPQQHAGTVTPKVATEDFVRGKVQFYKDDFYIEIVLLPGVKNPVITVERDGMPPVTLKLVEVTFIRLPKQTKTTVTLSADGYLSLRHVYKEKEGE